MTQPIVLLSTTAGLFFMIYGSLGYRATYQIGYGAFTLMAAMISLTFLWLWVKRATPLAMGMVFGWAGAASIMGWWWLYNLFSRPIEMTGNPFLFVLLSIYFVGAILHFSVIGRSFGWAKNTYLIPVLAAIMVSGVLHIIF